MFEDEQFVHTHALGACEPSAAVLPLRMEREADFSETPMPPLQ